MHEINCHFQNTIWKTNANKANALFMVRSQICKNGLVQLQDCIGELDNKQFAERYLYNHSIIRLLSQKYLIKFHYSLISMIDCLSK